MITTSLRIYIHKLIQCTHHIYQHFHSKSSCCWTSGGDDENSVLDDRLQLKPILSHKMSGSKPKASNTPSCPTTHGSAASMASKLAKMPAASSDANDTPGLVNESLDTLSRSQLVSELVNQ